MPVSLALCRWTLSFMTGFSKLFKTPFSAYREGADRKINEAVFDFKQGSLSFFVYHVKITLTTYTAGTFGLHVYYLNSPGLSVLQDMLNCLITICTLVWFALT